MNPLRTIAIGVAAGLCALGLSVGAALAEGPHDAAPPGKAGEQAPSGLCILHGL
jgi:hypothetical protein